MSHRILIAYVSRTGVTAEFAQTLAQAPAFAADSVQVLKMQDVRDLDGFDAVILGSSVRFGQWLAEAQKFVESRQKDLTQRPTALFTVHDLNRGGDAASRLQREAYLAKVRPLLQARCEGFFVGRTEAARLNFFERLLLRMIPQETGAPASPQALQAWAQTARTALFS